MRRTPAAVILLAASIATLALSQSGQPVRKAKASPSSAAQPSVTPQETPVSAVLQAVSPVSEEVVWIGGHEGILLRTRDGGQSWQRVPAPGGDTLQFRDVHAFSWDRAIAMSAGSGTASRIYATDDGGQSWHSAFLMQHPEGFLDCLDFWDGDRGFAYGDSFDGMPYALLTADAGRSWTRVTPDRLPAAAGSEGGFAASGTCARAGPFGAGWIATGAGDAPRLLATRDYGATWSATALPLPSGSAAGAFTIAIADGELVMALGGDLNAREEVVANAAFTPDGGGRWTQATSAPIPGAVYGSTVFVVPEGLRVVAVAPSGAAYTADSGQSWQPLPEVAAWAVAVAPSGRTGWAAGEGGRVWRIDW